jgi:hypothetical protein
MEDTLAHFVERDEADIGSVHVHQLKKRCHFERMVKPF